MRRTILLLMLVLGFSLSALAAMGEHKVKVSKETPIGGTVLKPGEYKLRFDDKEAVFLKRNEEVARVPVRQENAQRKYDYDALVYRGSDLTEIWLRGKDIKLVLNPGQASGG